MNQASNGSYNYNSPNGASYGSGSPGDTDIFMAIVAGSDAPQQPDYTYGQQQYGASFDDGYGQAPYGQPQYQPASSLPVNPLVAARSGASPQGTPTGSNLYPMHEVNPTVSKSFDTSFAERGGKKTVLLVIAAVLVVALLFLAGFYILNQRQAAEARTNIYDAIEEIRETDGVIVALDTALMNEFSTGVASTQLSDAMLQSSSASTKLSNADTLLGYADDSMDMLDATDVAGADAAGDAVSSRRSMLEIGRIVSTSSKAANTALENLAMAYGCIADANAKVQSSIDQYSAYYGAMLGGEDTSWFDMWALVQLDQEAQAAIVEAQGWVAAAKEAFPEADLSVLENYLVSRLAFMDLLVQIDTHLANGDAASADAIQQAYDDANAASWAAYEAVPATAAELLQGAYKAAVESQRVPYEAARERCLAADTELNGYLGITDATKKVGLTGSAALSAPAVAPITDTAAPEPTPVEGVTEGAPEGEGATEPAPTDVPA